MSQIATTFTAGSPLRRDGRFLELRFIDNHACQRLNGSVLFWTLQQAKSEHNYNKPFLSFTFAHEMGLQYDDIVEHKNTCIYKQWLGKHDIMHPRPEVLATRRTYLGATQPRSQ